MTGRSTLVAPYADQDETGSALIASGAEASHSPVATQRTLAESDDDGDSYRPHLGSLETGIAQWRITRPGRRQVRRPSVPAMAARAASVSSVRKTPVTGRAAGPGARRMRPPR
jgi:hypothetical protein